MVQHKHRSISNGTTCLAWQSKTWELLFNREKMCKSVAARTKRCNLVHEKIGDASRNSSPITHRCDVEIFWPLFLHKITDNYCVQNSRKSDQNWFDSDKGCKQSNLNMRAWKSRSPKCLLCFICRLSSWNTKNKSSLIPSCCSWCDAITSVPPFMNTFTGIKKVQLDNLKFVIQLLLVFDKKKHTYHASNIPDPRNQPHGT